jgi:CDP-2,3-bis-(O-geranylgeranyl)-sn-glycerol synthase
VAARWVYLPVLGAPVLHAPILRFDLLQDWKVPIDGGRTFRGRRILGDNKTWRGAAAMTSGPLLATLLLSRSPWWRSKLPPEVRDAPAPALGLLLGLSVWAGELPNSFAKRQIGIAPGAQRSDAAGVALTVLDQGDFVLASALLLRPVWRMTPAQLAEAFATVAAVHLPIGVIGKLLGVRSSAL